MIRAQSYQDGNVFEREGLVSGGGFNVNLLLSVISEVFGSGKEVFISSHMIQKRGVRMVNGGSLPWLVIMLLLPLISIILIVIIMKSKRNMRLVVFTIAGIFLAVYFIWNFFLR